MCWQGQSLRQRGHHQLPVLVHDVKRQGLADFLDGAPPKLWGGGKEAVRAGLGILKGPPLPSQRTQLTAVEYLSQARMARICQWGCGEGRGDQEALALLDSAPRGDCHGRCCTRKPGNKRQPPPRHPLLIPKWMSPKTAPRSQILPLNRPRR